MCYGAFTVRSVSPTYRQDVVILDTPAMVLFKLLPADPLFGLADDVFRPAAVQIHFGDFFMECTNAGLDVVVMYPMPCFR